MKNQALAFKKLELHFKSGAVRRCPFGEVWPHRDSPMTIPVDDKVFFHKTSIPAEYTVIYCEL